MNSTTRTSRIALAAAAALSLALLARPASATVIGFEDFGYVGTSGPAVTTQYLSDGVVFSSTGSEFNQVSSQPGIGDGLNFLCTGTGAIDCTGETILSFTQSVSNLSFLAVGSNAGGTQALVDVFVNNALAATVNVNVGGVFNTPDAVDLTSFSYVTSIRIHGITDPGGLGWDNFSYTAVVPEPAGVALMLAGLGLVGGLARRKQRR